VIVYSVFISTTEIFELRHDETSIVPIETMKRIYEEYFMIVEA